MSCIDSEFQIVTAKDFPTYKTIRIINISIALMQCKNGHEHGKYLSNLKHVSL